MSRITTGYVSDYSADAVQVLRIRRPQRRTMTANFNGAMPAGALMSNVIWSTDSPWVIRISSAAGDADARTATVIITANYGGFATLKCEAWTGAWVLTYQWDIEVVDRPLMPTETYLDAGPYSLTAVPT